MIKTTGAEFTRFYNDPEVWTGDAFHEGEFIILNGVEMEEGGVDFSALNDEDAIQLEGGVVYGDQRGETELGSMEGLFRKWKKKQACVFFTVEAPKDKFDAIKAAIKAAGGKIAR